VFHDRMCLIYKSEFRKSMRGQALIEAVSNKLSWPETRLLAGRTKN